MCPHVSAKNSKILPAPEQPHNVKGEQKLLPGGGGYLCLGFIFHRPWTAPNQPSFALENLMEMISEGTGRRESEICL